MDNIKEIDTIYNDLNKHINSIQSELICNYIYQDKLLNFLIFQIKNNNYTLLQLLFLVFKNNIYIRTKINKNMIELLILSMNNSIIFLEMCHWFDEFGYDDSNLKISIGTALYIYASKHEETKKYILKLLKNTDNKIHVNDKTIYFIQDEVDLIIKYIPKDKKLLQQYIIRCYQYDSIHTLRKIQTITKNKFYTFDWYICSPIAFNKVMKISNRNPYEDNDFAFNWIKYVCSLLRWDYLPTIVNKMNDKMWRVVASYFYMGRIDIDFLTVLLHQMKKYNIPIKKLKLDGIMFNHTSIYVNYLKDNNLYNIFSTEKNPNGLRIVPLDDLHNDIVEASVTSITAILFIINQKKISDIVDLVFDSTLNLSNRYTSEIKYVDELLANDELGWDSKQIELYTNFKIIMDKIITDANLCQNIVDKYNSYLPMQNTTLSFGYKLRFVNEIIDMYKKVSFKKFQDEYQQLYDNCIIIKTFLIHEIRKEINCSKPSVEFFTIPSNPNIYDLFQNLLENCSNYEYTYQHLDKKYIELFINNKKIQNIIDYMLHEGAIPLQCIQPIIYNNYYKYSTEEHLFLE